jgi:hypothetical protein
LARAIAAARSVDRYAAAEDDGAAVLDASVLGMSIPGIADDVDDADDEAPGDVGSAACATPVPRTLMATAASRAMRIRMYVVLPDD